MVTKLDKHVFIDSRETKQIDWLGFQGLGMRSTHVLMSRANRIRAKLQSALEATAVEVEDVSYKHAGHAAVKDSPAGETHFNLSIVSPKFDGQSLVKRHRMVYDLLGDELQSGLHALSIVAKTPQEAEKH